VEECPITNKTAHVLLVDIQLPEPEDVISLLFRSMVIKNSTKKRSRNWKNEIFKNNPKNL
jgi:hypothetical protein